MRRLRSPAIASPIAVVMTLAIVQPARSAPPDADPQPEEPTRADVPEDAPLEAPAAEPAEPDEPTSTVTELGGDDRPADGGVTEAVVSTEDPAPEQAPTNRGNEASEREAEGPSERMPRLQLAASWTLFGAIVLGTVGGGVFFGLAQRKQDEAERLGSGFDPETGERLEHGEHQALLDESRAYRGASLGIVIAAGAALAASITLFAVHARRAKREDPRMVLRSVSPFAIELGF